MIHGPHSQSGSHAKRLKRDFVDMFIDDRCQSSPPENNLTSSSEFIPDDLLTTEIFPRLTDARTAIRFSAVSKHWHSLLTAPEFLSDFLRRRAPSSYATFVEFRFRYSKTCTTRQLCPRTLITEEGSPSVAAAGATSDYNFSGEADIALESSCDEFLLLSRITTDENWVTERHLYIRNALTGLGLELPKLPAKVDQRGSGALSIRRRRDPNNKALNFRVLYLYRDSDSNSNQIIIFSSETGRWSGPIWSPPPSKGMLSGVVAAGGLLFWLDGNDSDYYKRLVIYNPFDRSWGFILKPAGLVSPESHYRWSAVEFGPAGEVFQLGSRRRPRMGTVKGRIRLGQLFRTVARGEFNIKIWELSDGNYISSIYKWSLVSEVKVRDPPLEGIKWLYLLSFHPDDSDIVFLCCDCDVYRYCLSRGEYERVFTLSCGKAEEDQSVKDWLPRFAQVFTVRIPPWPTTTMPMLPSSHV